MLKNTSLQKKSFTENDTYLSRISTLKRQSNKNRTSTMGHVENFETQETVQRMKTDMMD